MWEHGFTCINLLRLADGNEDTAGNEDKGDNSINVLEDSSWR